MKKIIPYGKHFIDDDDIKAVVNVLKFKNLTQGDEVSSFEESICKYVGVKYAVAVSSWTSGLHLANLAIGVKKNDEVVTSPITFVATSNSVLYCNAKPVFSEINKESINLCPIRLEETLIKHPNAKVIIPVHYAGLPCEMKSINKIAKKRNLHIIEDAAHALGAKYQDGSMVGSCKYSDITGFSLHPVKSIAAGEGGVLTTNNITLYKKLIRLRSHGINKLDDILLNKSNGFSGLIKNPWYYEMQELGYNYRITDFQCALAKSQLKKLPEFIEKRKELVFIYDSKFQNMKNLTPIQTNYRNQSSHHLYVVRINFKKVKVSRAELMNLLEKKGIITQVHYLPVTSHPYYQNLGFKTSEFKESIKFYSECLSLPLYFTLSNSDQQKVIDSIKTFIK